MKLPRVPGEFAFKALVQVTGMSGWYLSGLVFFTKEEAQGYFARSNIKWPVEVYEDGTVYVPAEEELKETK